ncbi:MAG: winged helix-turn-helix domain-containing protein [Candidatus Atabeyarchaeum deiterrae]
MEESMVLKDPDKIRISLEPLNRKILDLLMDREMTITMLANSIKDKGKKGVPAPTILRRVRKLVEAELIEQTRVGTPPKSKAKNLLEKFYRTKASKFLIDTEISKMLKGKERASEPPLSLESIPIIQSYGYDVPERAKEDFASKVTELQHLLEEKSRILTTRKLPVQKQSSVDARTDEAIFQMLLSLEGAKDERIRKLVDEINRNLKK